MLFGNDMIVQTSILAKIKQFLRGRYLQMFGLKLNKYKYFTPTSQ